MQNPTLFKDLAKPEGLSEGEATQRLAKEGYNELPYAEERGAVKLIFEVIKEPMFLLLIACGAI